MAIRSVLLTLFLLFFQELNAYNCSMTYVDTPINESRFYGGFTWLYLLPTVSDADLQFGMALTFTGPPVPLDQAQNLTADVLQIEPDYTSGYRFNLGYLFACNNCLDLDYFHFRASDSDSGTSPIRNESTYQFLQNFLGGGYVSSKAKDTQKIDQIYLSLGRQYLIDNCLNIHPYIGASFAYIQRDLNVEFTDFVIPPIINPASAILVGSLKSCSWGLGPVIGSTFSLPLFSCFEFFGHFGVSILGGKAFSKIDSTSNRFEIGLVESFSADNSFFRVIPMVRNDLGFAYNFPICNQKLALNFSIGYQVDYYFRAVDRVNPFNGYVNNPNATATTTTSSIGLGGPYAQIALTTYPLSCPTKHFIHTLFAAQNPTFGFYFNVENGWLEPSPTAKDLTYAILSFSNGSSQDEKIVPDHSRSGSYYLGYRFCSNFNLEGNYRHFNNKANDSVAAGASGGISSLNASGLDDVVFSNASSRVSYQLHQVDLSGGKYARIGNPFELYGFVGLRYLNLERTLHNEYLGGEPPDITQSKFPVLKSDYWGIGPITGIKPSFYIYDNLGLKGLLDVALLVGQSNSKLDQVNFGTVIGPSSNTLRTRNIQTIVPIIDTKIGLFWTFKWCRNFECDLEGGFLFSYYFRALNLVFPNFLTGLGQNNSNLLLSGPYITLQISGF